MTLHSTHPPPARLPVRRTTFATAPQAHPQLFDASESADVRCGQRHQLDLLSADQYVPRTFPHDVEALFLLDGLQPYLETWSALILAHYGGQELASSETIEHFLRNQTVSRIELSALAQGLASRQGDYQSPREAGLIVHPSAHPDQEMARLRSFHLRRPVQRYCCSCSPLVQ